MQLENVDKLISIKKEYVNSKRVWENILEYVVNMHFKIIKQWFCNGGCGNGVRGDRYHIKLIKIFFKYRKVRSLIVYIWILKNRTAYVSVFGNKCNTWNNIGGKGWGSWCMFCFRSYYEIQNKLRHVNLFNYNKIFVFNLLLLKNTEIKQK